MLVKNSSSTAHRSESLHWRVLFAELKAAAEGSPLMSIEPNLPLLSGLPFGTVSIEDRAKVDWVIAEEVARGEWD